VCFCACPYDEYYCSTVDRLKKKRRVAEADTIAGPVYEGVNELDEREVPSLAKEGCREAAGWFDQEINNLTNTTPALRATPPLLRSLRCRKKGSVSGMERCKQNQTLKGD
jgi:hypothetical protein